MKVHIVEISSVDEIFSYMEIYDSEEKAIAAYNRLYREKEPNEHIIVYEQEVL